MDWEKYEAYPETVKLLKLAVKNIPAFRVWNAGAWVLSEEEYVRLKNIEHKSKTEKRKPYSNGVLPLTEEEREELTEAEESLFKQISEVRVEENVIKYDAGGYTYTVESIAVFQYLAERFDLEKSI